MYSMSFFLFSMVSHFCGLTTLFFSISSSMFPPLWCFSGHIMLLIVIIAYSFVLPPDFKINCSRSKRSTHASTTCCSNDKIKCCKPCADPSGFIHITKFNCNRKKPPNNKKTTPYKRTCLSVLCCSQQIGVQRRPRSR
jgi:hypothetical protein